METHGDGASMHGSPEDLIEGTRYYVHFEIPVDDTRRVLSAGTFRAKFERLDIGDDKQLYAYFKGGNYVDVRHIRYINVADEA